MHSFVIRLVKRHKKECLSNLAAAAIVFDGKCQSDNKNIIHHRHEWYELKITYYNSALYTSKIPLCVVKHIDR